MSTPPFEAIDGLNITDALQQGLAGDRITSPTPVQTEGIAAIIAGKHVVLQSGTGTGKTLAYLIPILQKLEQNPAERAVVFAPGAELAMQTLRVATAYKPERIKAGAAISTSSHRRQRKRVDKSTRLVIGTPDRLIELYKSKKLKQVRTVVLDEIEPILGARDADFLYELFARSEPKVQLIIAAATLGPRSEAFINRFMSEDCVHVTPAQRPLESAIAHRVVVMGDTRAKDLALARFIHDFRC